MPRVERIPMKPTPNIAILIPTKNAKVHFARTKKDCFAFMRIPYCGCYPSTTIKLTKCRQKVTCLRCKKKLERSRK
ncbi:MAG: hypothetical protein GY861_28675 [bacterium]|nr:hypothetical protein [bacterium]